jgi:hypothetical protein
MPAELKALNGYLRQRQAALHSATLSLLAGTLVKIQESRPMEIIRLLDWTPGLFKSRTSEDEEEEIQ